MGRATARDKLVGSLLDRIDALEARLRRLEVSHPGAAGTGAGSLVHVNADGMADASAGGVLVRSVTDNVSNPPTAAQLVSAFGAAGLGDGLRGVIDDNAGGTLWVVFVTNGKWGVEGLTLRA